MTRRPKGEWRPVEPAAWLAASAAEALPGLLLRAQALRHRRSRRPDVWTQEDRIELDEIESDVQLARRLALRKLTWEELGHGADDVPDYLRSA